MMYKIRIISVARPRNTFKLLLLAPTFAFGVVNGSLAAASDAEVMALASSSTTKAQRKRSIGVAVK